jgi:hypothetical protein
MEMKKSFIRGILETSDTKKETIDRLKKRYKYLKSKNYAQNESNQTKYIKFHLRKLGVKTI